MATKSAFRSGGNAKGSLERGARNGKSLSKSGGEEDEGAQFSHAVKDMKSLLPGYDEATAFAYEQGRHMGRHGGVPGAMPKAGRSIPKLNIEDLPMHYASDEVVLTGKTRSSLRNSSKQSKPTSILDDYNLMSKFDATVFNVDTKLTQAATSKLKSHIVKSKAAMEVEANSVTDNVRADYLKIKSHVIGEIENELGFGFRPPDVNILQKNSKRASSEDTQKAMHNAAKKTETSVKALKKKINSKREEWKNDQFSWDGFHIKQPKIPAVAALSSSFESRSSAQRPPPPPPNEKLKEMSDSFRKSLRVNTDMKRAIKTPRSSSTAGKTAKEKGIDMSSSVESMLRTAGSSSIDEHIHQAMAGDEGSESGRSSLFTRSTATYHHPTSADKAGTAGKQRPTFGGKGRQSKPKRAGDVDSSSKSSVDIAGIMPLNSLLSSANSENRYHPDSAINKTDSAHSERRKSSNPLLLNFHDLKDATSRLAAAQSPRSRHDSINNNHRNNNVTKVDSVTQKDYGGGETKILSENFYKPPAEKKETGVGVNVPVNDFLKQRLGESVKTVDDAATLATRLGSLMTRVAMSKNGQTAGPGGSSLDAVSLARELREIASSMEKDYGGALGLSAQSSAGNVEVQTDKEKKLIPQPKFTKEMSYTDQLVLQQLRAIRHQWNTAGGGSDAKDGGGVNDAQFTKT